jgi:hypothetical protein
LTFSENPIVQWLRWILILTVPWLAVLLFGGGCMMPDEPETRFGVNVWTHSWEFRDTKDNRVTIKNARYNAATKEASVELVEIENSASAVIREQVEQMKIWNEQMRTANEGIRDTMAGLTSIAGTLTAPLRGASGTMPMPWGTGTLNLGGATTQPSQ